MNDMSHNPTIAAAETGARPAYVTPVVRVMSDAEVLSAFQVTAASPTVTWWAC